jgi:hypothetical protein
VLHTQAHQGVGAGIGPHVKGGRQELALPALGVGNGNQPLASPALLHFEMVKDLLAAQNILALPACYPQEDFIEEEDLVFLLQNQEAFGELLDDLDDDLGIDRAAPPPSLHSISYLYMIILGNETFGP